VGLGGIGPKPQSPIPNPQSPIPNPHFIEIKIIKKLGKIHILTKNNLYEKIK
jgi:hypothetical protein